MKNWKKIIQYSPLLKVPRRLFKYILSGFYPIVTKFFPLPIVKSIPETIDKINSQNLSIARFGDGELLYVSERRSLPFQKQDERLREYFMEILNSDLENLLIGLPVGFYSLNNLKRSSYHTWRAIISWTYPGVRKYLRKNKVYYNASFTRPYMDYEDKNHSQMWFKEIRKIWDDREILLIEGEKSRLGIGNDLFENSKNVERILGPANNAFTQFEEILAFAKQQSKQKLILIAMGPTAKPLAFELTLNGFQAIDIGNIDIEYEWFLREAEEKIKIPGKYTSEAKGGREVADIKNEKYDKQVTAKFL